MPFPLLGISWMGQQLRLLRMVGWEGLEARGFSIGSPWTIGFARWPGGATRS